LGRSTTARDSSLPTIPIATQAKRAVQHNLQCTGYHGPKHRPIHTEQFAAHKRVGIHADVRDLIVALSDRSQPKNKLIDSGRYRDHAVRGPIHSSIARQLEKYYERVLLLARWRMGVRRIRGACIRHRHTLDALKRSRIRTPADKAAAELPVRGVEERFRFRRRLVRRRRGNGDAIPLRLPDAQPGALLYRCNERMRQPANRELVDSLRQLGVSLEYRGAEGFPPILNRHFREAIRGRPNGHQGRTLIANSFLLADAGASLGQRIGPSRRRCGRPTVHRDDAKVMQSWGATTSRRGDVIEILVRSGTRAMDSKWSRMHRSASYSQQPPLFAEELSRSEGIHSTFVQGDVAVHRVAGKMGAAASVDQRMA